MLFGGEQVPPAIEREIQLCVSSPDSRFRMAASFTGYDSNASQAEIVSELGGKAQLCAFVSEPYRISVQPESTVSSASNPDRMAGPRSDGISRAAVRFSCSVSRVIQLPVEN